MASKTQRSFASGEIAPALYGRADLVKFASGLATCRNFHVLKHGGAANRAGFGYVASVKDHAVRTYLTKFVYNDEQTFVIEVGDQYFRFFAQGAVVGAPYELATPYLEADLAELRFEQSENVVTITHDLYAPRELRRISDTSWTLTTVSTQPSIAAPANLVATAGAGSTFTYAYKVCAIEADTYESSLPSAEDTCSCDTPNPTAPNTLAWDAVAGAVEYDVFSDMGDGNGFGYIGTTTALTFNDVGFIADMAYPPPSARVLFNSANNYPKVSGYHQQRRLFGATISDPNKAWASKLKKHSNFSVSSPIQDDDAVTFSVASRKAHEIRAFVEMDELLLLTSNGLWWVAGNQEGALTPFAIYPRPLSNFGSATVAPVVAGRQLVYLQARGKILRGFHIDNKSADDLTLFAPHLLKRYSLERFDYAELPYSIVWGVRADGTLLSLTTHPEHGILGWARHDTDGIFEDVVVVPEGDEDAVYVIVKRTIGTLTKRYVERLTSREFTDIRTDAIFVDSFLTYDGRNSGTDTMRLSTAAGWTVDDLITVTASASTFDSGDVGNAVVILDEDGAEVLRVTIAGYTSPTVVTGYPSIDIDVPYQDTPTTSWALAVDGVSGLDHLEEKTVSILGDGNVHTQQTVVGGAIDIGFPRSVIHVGLAITADLETLDLDSAEAEVRDKRKKLESVSLVVESSRGIFAGPDEDHLYEYKPEITEYTEATPLVTGTVEIPITSTWDLAGRVLVRQTDPLPLTVLALIPNFEVGG